MVLWYRSEHNYDFNFATVSLAYFIRYPNPFASHVLSDDTIERFVDAEGKLHSTRIIYKQGKLPRFVRPFLKKVGGTWILEKSIINPQTCEMQTWTSNLDHRRILQVHESAHYKSKSLNAPSTSVRYDVSFSSNFGSWGIKDRIESWSYTRFGENLNKSKKGMFFVMSSLKEHGWNKLREMQIAIKHQPIVEE
ncbi:MSF1-domain-containing protein [Nadsonia fulvescens var. elongata DSM 6958]|uniref:MSF1-domain-containing protein n=1 Tax=Nadsonia fulvescens var. elongata DSM 6958 TaxID=857566 RepID=A0A1E3PLY4_9ASCO|nr:MSF1-domain-containing protein [Nadsonia fulvescens var. elongata DSM 6958]